MKYVLWVFGGAFVLYIISKVIESVFGVDLHRLTGDDPKDKHDP